MLDEDDLARVALVEFGYNCGILFRDLLFFGLCNFLTTLLYVCGWGGVLYWLTRVPCFVVCGKHLYLVVSHTLEANKRNPRVSLLERCLLFYEYRHEFFVFFPGNDFPPP